MWAPASGATTTSDYRLELSRKTVMNTEYDGWLGLEVGKTTHHGCGLDPTGQRIFDHELPLDQTVLRDVSTSLQHEYGSVLVIADHLNTIGALRVPFARDCGTDIAFRPGAAMRKADDLYPGQTTIDAWETHIIAEPVSNPGLDNPTPRVFCRAASH